MYTVLSVIAWSITYKDLDLPLKVEPITAYQYKIIFERIEVYQTSQVSRFCRDSHGFQFSLTVSQRDTKISQ